MKLTRRMALVAAPTGGLLAGLLCAAMVSHLWEIYVVLGIINYGSLPFSYWMHTQKKAASTSSDPH